MMAGLERGIMIQKRWGLGRIRRSCQMVWQDFARKVNDLGLSFGIWVEPEMVNVDSDLYRAHPGGSMEIPGKDHAEGRNQKYLISQILRLWII